MLWAVTHSAGVSTCLPGTLLCVLSGAPGGVPHVQDAGARHICVLEAQEVSIFSRSSLNALTKSAVGLVLFSSELDRILEAADFAPRECVVLAAQVH